MGVGVGVGETLFAGASGGRANDPFGSKSDREVDGALEQAILQSANRLTGQGLTLQKFGNPLLSQTNAAISNELSNLPSLSDPITLDTLTSNPSFGAIKGAIESQFNNARDSAIATGGTGGALTGVLGDLEASRAGSLAQGLGQLALTEDARRQGIFNSVVSAGGQLGIAETGQAIDAFQGASGAEGGLAQAQAAIAQANIAGDASNKNAKVGFQGDQFNNLSEGAGALAGGK